jgi:hypothetical protein
MIKVFVGYDQSEAVSFNVLSHSIQSNSSVPVAIIPVRLSQLGGVFNRERNALQSTEFSFSRFLVPYLCDYEGWAIFMDCDMLVKADIKELWDQRDDRYAVQVVKHDHQPEENVKFLGAVQTKYEKKNWSSVMLFNCKKCKALTPDYVNTASGLQLHRLSGWNRTSRLAKSRMSGTTLWATTNTVKMPSSFITQQAARISKSIRTVITQTIGLLTGMICCIVRSVVMFRKKWVKLSCF